MTSVSRICALLLLLIIVVFTGCGGNSASVPPPAGGSETFQPSYYILSLGYAPLGALSGNAYYAGATTDGLITDVSGNFEGSPTLSYAGSDGVSGSASDLGPSFAIASGTGNQTFQDTYTNVLAAGNLWSITGAVTSASDSIDHTQDVFFLWLNPQVVVTQTGSDAASFTIGTPKQQGGQPEPMDVISVSVAELLNPTLIPSWKLGSQTVDGVGGLPGLASLCANPAQCAPSDFADIVNFDPLVSVDPTEPPSNTDPVRFVFVASTTMSGPQSPGGNIPLNGFWGTDSTLSSTSVDTFSYTTSLRAPIQTSGSFTLRLAQNNSFTWKHLTALGSASGLHQAQVILGSTVVDCYEHPGIYEDTLFHTFLFQQPSGNTGC